MDITTHIQGISQDRAIPILALAALFGRDFSIDWIQGLSEERASNVLAAMEEGVAQGILKQSKVGVYVFIHPQKQTEYLSSFSEEEKGMLHRRVVDHIQR